MRKRSLQNLSNQVNLTCDPGNLIPLDYWDVLPGDSFQASSALLVRSTPLLAPIMHPLIVRLHYWYVPYRLIWDDTEDFFTGGEDGTSTPAHPVINLAAVTQSSLYNYLGLPAETFGASLDIDALPLRAYSKIWNEHYRDGDLATERTIDTTSGTDSTTDVTIAKVAWPKDYLTTARPWEQKGNAVTIPLLGTAPITGFGAEDLTGTRYYRKSVYESDGTNPAYAVASLIGDSTANANHFIELDGSGYPNVEADLTAASGVDIADLGLH